MLQPDALADDLSGKLQNQNREPNTLNNNPTPRTLDPENNPKPRLFEQLNSLIPNLNLETPRVQTKLPMLYD